MTNGREQILGSIRKSLKRGPVTQARRTEIRQALGVLDTVFLGEPGVLEARQRLTLRMRAAART